MCRLLVKNLTNSWLCGDVISIHADSHEFGAMEQRSKFHIKYPGEQWPRHFVIVNLPNEPIYNFEHLLESNEDGARVYYIEPQLQDSPYYQELYDNAEITTTAEILNSLVRLR